MAAPKVHRRDVLRFRVHRHQLDHAPGSANSPTDVALLDYGVQDTGPDGASWALAVRGASPADERDLVYAWTLRGAPHAYRRGDVAAVVVATAPLSEADAAKRIYDAAKPLKAAGIPVLDALRVVARGLRKIAAKPTAKGDASSRLTRSVTEPYLRYCQPCDATHLYEMPFRLAALQAGVELERGTSPPVLHRVRDLRPAFYGHLATEAEPRFDVIRNHLRFYGPARARDVAAFLDVPLREIKASWPDDALEVAVADGVSARAGDARFVLADDLDELRTGESGDGRASAVRLLGPYDPYLQLRDRELLVADEAKRKDLWRVLGRPGAIVLDGEIVGTWRPRASGSRLTVLIEPWRRLRAAERAGIQEQAETLAAHRGATLAGVGPA